VFGADRCLYGSDWPVVSTVGDPAGWLRLVLASVPDLSAREVALVLGGTAERVYGLQPPLLVPPRPP
jgi:L-fuconolactonase